MWHNSIEYYISQFPESQFLVPKQHQTDYASKVILGHTKAQKSNVLICGIARDVGDILPTTLARINRLGSYFYDYSVFIYENDSIDNTASFLKNYANTQPYYNIVLNDIDPPQFTDLKGQDRRTFMAMARNNYLNFAREYIQTHRVDYIIIVDMDLLGGWSYDGVLNSLGHTDWDIIGSNSIYYYEENNQLVRLFYDAWAFRKLGEPEAKEDVVYNVMKFNRGEPMQLVNSCFGGLAIYTPDFLFEGIDYTSEDCDHVTLHNKLCDKGYKIYINPSQITLYNKTQYVI